VSVAPPAPVVVTPVVDPTLVEAVVLGPVVATEPVPGPVVATWPVVAVVTLPLPAEPAAPPVVSGVNSDPPQATKRAIAAPSPSRCTFISF
jgi:hypothetical protein